MPQSSFRTVGDVMTRKLVTLKATDTIAHIDEGMHRLRVRHLPVIDDEGKLIGLVSHPDLLHASASYLFSREREQNAIVDQVPVGRIMQQEVLVIHPNDPLIEAAKLMWDAKVGCLPVCEDGGKLVGIVTEADFLAVTIELLGGQITKSDVEELANPPGSVRTIAF